MPWARVLIADLLPAAALLLAVLTWLSPAWALSLLLAGLPFFLHHPSSPLAHTLIALVLTTQVVYAVRIGWAWPEEGRAALRHPLLLLGALFVAAAFLSLSSLPLVALWREYTADHSWPPGDWFQRVRAWLSLSESRREFPITAAWLTLQAFALALMVWRETRRANAVAGRFAAAITLGMVTFVGLGMLGAWGSVNIDALRGAAFVEVRPGSLQSTAGNPGWFAQYLAYALPYALVLLAGRSWSRWRVPCVMAITALTTLALVVSGQRGGWIAGAVAVVYMAVVGPTILPSTSTTTPHATIWRTVAALGTILLLVAGGFWLWLTQWLEPETPFGAAMYVERFQSIASGDRWPFVPVSVEMARLHPVLGGGHESFAYLYQRYFQQPDGVFHAWPPLVQSASAHNVFLQTLTGTGLVGAALLLAIFVVAAYSAARGHRESAAAHVISGVRLASAGSLLVVACYGLVQEVFYIHALRLLFFFGLGLLAATTASVEWPRRIGTSLWLALGVAFLVHLGFEHWRPGPERLLPAATVTGLHGEEPRADGSPVRWSTEWATWPVPAEAATYSLRVRSLAPFAQEMEITPCRGQRSRMVLRDHDWHVVEGSVAGCEAGGRLHLHVSPAWRPRGDGRLLGVMTADVRFE